MSVKPWLSVDTTRPHIAQEIHESIARAVSDGSLPPGTQLPSVRALAKELDVAVNTVAKAFKSLEAAGLVSTHGRSGTRVESSSTAVDGVREALELAAVRAKAAGMDTDAARSIFEAVFVAAQHKSQ